NVGGITGNNAAAYISDRSWCANTVDTANQGYYKKAADLGFSGTFYWVADGGGGKYWEGLFSGLFTVMPPNGASCGNRNNRALGLMTPTSMHTGGVQCSRADGSVTFINKGIDAGPELNTVISAATTADAPSPFGVWGALGSRAGGESKSP
ncbi:MAG: DUF1559 domain-containing protein, partial [Planctomycetaceae bacterium]|nr:DUF1559 domain-containing protein [Planctomycetaceae bacterium]